jgi:hypothetical protein
MELLLTERRVSRFDVLEAFRTSESYTARWTPAALRAKVQVTAGEENALVGVAVGNAHPYWGFSTDLPVVIPRPESPAENLPAATWLDLLSQVNVFLHRSGLKFSELLDLVTLDFVHGSSRFQVDGSPDDVDEARYFNFTLANFTDGHARRTSFFIRLWRKLGVSMRELDWFLHISEDDAIPATLASVAIFTILRQELGLSFGDALVLMGDLDIRRTVRAKKSAFDQIFLAGSASQQEYRKLEELGRSASASPIALSTPAIIDGYRAYLRGALHLKDEDIDALFVQLLPGPAPTLTVANLSQMARIALFSRAVRISVSDYFELFGPSELLEIDPFPPVSSVRDAAAWRTRALGILNARTAVRLLGTQRLGARQSSYLLLHEVNPEDGFLPDRTVFEGALTRLSVLSGEARASYPFLASPTSEALGVLLAELVPADRVPRMLGILLASPTSDPDGFLLRYLAVLPNGAAIVGGLLSEPEPEVRVRTLYAPLREYLVTRARTTAALAAFSELFGVSPVQADLLLRSGLKRALPGSTEPALNDWIAAIRGGFATGEESLSALPPAPSARTTHFVARKDGNYRLLIQAHGGERHPPKPDRHRPRGTQGRDGGPGEPVVHHFGHAHVPAQGRQRRPSRFPSGKFGPPHVGNVSARAQGSPSHARAGPQRSRARVFDIETELHPERLASRYFGSPCHAGAL